MWYRYTTALTNPCSTGTLQPQPTHAVWVQYCAASWPTCSMVQCSLGQCWVVWVDCSCGIGTIHQKVWIARANLHFNPQPSRDLNLAVIHFSPKVIARSNTLTHICNQVTSIGDPCTSTEHFTLSHGYCWTPGGLLVESTWSP